jgi:hypothetical protein
METNTRHDTTHTTHALRDYDVCAFDCYAIASCMEAWLSQLPEPIIGEEFYNDCVKNANRPDQSLLIIDRIPEVTRHDTHTHTHDTQVHIALTALTRVCGSFRSTSAWSGASASLCGESRSPSRSSRP